jgi:hypothetical protein
LKRRRGHAGPDGPDHHLLPWLKRRVYEAELERKVQAIVDEAEEELPSQRAGGDAEELRGIPLMAPGGLGGAIKGTRPEDCLRDVDGRP